MNWAQFKDPHGYLCLHGTKLACWFLRQEVGVYIHLFAKIISTDSVDYLEFI